jgi:hypothetical protein
MDEAYEGFCQYPYQIARECSCVYEPGAWHCKNVFLLYALHSAMFCKGICVVKTPFWCVSSTGQLWAKCFVLCSLLFSKYSFFKVSLHHKAFSKSPFITKQGIYVPITEVRFKSLVSMYRGMSVHLSASAYIFKFPQPGTQLQVLVCIMCLVCMSM